jgi:competence ComEA-like helix-hairpin-helix protein
MLRLRLPVLTPAEKTAFLVLLGILGSGAGLRAWERSGMHLGPVNDWESLHRWVIQSKQNDTTAFACSAFPTASGPHWPTRTGTAPDEPGTKTHATHPKKVPPASPLNLNTASAETLQSLPGVGPSTANAIVASREVEGKFQSVEELTRVKGIGSKKLAALRNFVRIQ